MWSGRRWRGGRDGGEISLLAAFVALMVGGALAGVEIAANAPANRNSSGVFVQINHASAVRTSNDGVQFTINYTAAVAADPSGPGSWTTASKIYCIASARGGSGAWSSREITTFIVSGYSQTGATTITFDYADPNPSTVSVSCDVTREGDHFHSGVVDVTVPAASFLGGGGSTPTPTPSPTPSASFDVSKYTGTYPVTFTTVVGIVLNCGPSSVSAVMNVASLGGTRIKVGISSAAVLGASTSFETDLAPTAQFSGELPTFGLVSGRFVEEAGRISITARATSPDGHCTWSIEGHK